MAKQLDSSCRRVIELKRQLENSCVTWKIAIKPMFICVDIWSFTYLLLKKVECLRAAVELTRRLLTQCGQGANASSQTVQHTVYSLQVSASTSFCLSVVVCLHMSR